MDEAFIFSEFSMNDVISEVIERKNEPFGKWTRRTKIPQINPYENDKIIYLKD